MARQAAATATQNETANAASENTENQTNETQGGNEGDENKVTEFTFGAIGADGHKELAEAIWANVQGQNYQERHDALQVLFSQMRDARDSNKTTRSKKTLEEILQEAVGKPMGELQAVKVPLGAISISLPQIVKLAQSESEGAMEKMAKEFVTTHKLKIVKKKMSSKGKESTLLEAA